MGAFFVGPLSAFFFYRPHVLEILYPKTCVLPKTTTTTTTTTTNARAHKLTEIFLQVTFHAVKGDSGEGLTVEDYVSLGSPVSHSLLEGYSLNMGNAELEKLSRHYPIISRLYYLERYSAEAKKTFLR